MRKRTRGVGEEMQSVRSEWDSVFAGKIQPAVLGGYAVAPVLTLKSDGGKWEGDNQLSGPCKARKVVT